MVRPQFASRKRIRLDPAAYAIVGTICSVTIGVRGRSPVFADVRATAAAIDVLHGHATKTSVLVYGYCMMPHHVHLVIGPSPQCDVIAFVGGFKGLVQRAAWKLGVRVGFGRPVSTTISSGWRSRSSVSWSTCSTTRSGQGWSPLDASTRFRDPSSTVRDPAAGDKPPPYDEERQDATMPAESAHPQHREERRQRASSSRHRRPAGGGAEAAPKERRHRRHRPGTVSRPTVHHRQPYRRAGAHRAGPVRNGAGPPPR